MKRIAFTVLVSVFLLNVSAQDKFTDPRDGNSYRTIKIDGMTWMAENLKYHGEGNGNTFFDHDQNNNSKYGVLYDWKTAVKACPDGWHLPSGSEYRSLMGQIEGEEQKEKEGSGPALFGKQLAGMQDYEGTFTEMDESAYYWTSTEYNKDEAEYFSYLIIGGKAVMDISRKADMPDIHGAEKSNKYSVRCVKN